VKKFICLTLLFVIVGGVFAQESSDEFVFGDMRPDAPELAPRGQYSVGVQTIELTNPDQIDILSYSEDNPEPRYDRSLTVEVWYPTGEGEDAVIEYEDTLGRADNPNAPLVPFTFSGRATRDAEPNESGAPYPLLIVSHGFPGSRFMMTYLTENLASKGYVVAAIDHTESVFSDVSGFPSTLLNRPLDILFVLDQMAELGAEGSDNFLAGLVDADNTGLIGYSMGGYGAINAAGGAFGQAYIPTLTQFGIPSVDLLEVRTVGNEAYTTDERIKAVFAFAPWGMQFNLWDEESLAGLEAPLFLVAGTQDDVSGYDPGIRGLFENATNSERYLLSLEGARHNVAPNPPPSEASDYDSYMRYADSVWDSARMNNIMQHFATAFFGEYLKGEDYEGYLDLIENSEEGVYAVDEQGEFTEEHTYWQGFQQRSAVGLRFERSAAGEE
jgi:predicted dienelactone hydrolase